VAESVLVIGTHLTTLPFRLAGGRIKTPAAGAATPAFREALDGEAAIVVLSATCAKEIPPELIAQARRAGRPLVLVLPDGGAEELDVARLARRVLGLRA
jgi:vacuolar-type H+-ATPase subunit F/Vma7